MLYVTCRSRIQSTLDVYGFKVKIYQLTHSQKLDLDDVIDFFYRQIWFGYTEESCQILCAIIMKFGLK